jgi:hypothetical protein
MYTSDDINDRRGNHPYVLELKHRLRDMTTHVQERGTAGATAANLLHTLAPILAKENKSDSIFVFILAGTNDLAFRTSPMSILWHLKRMHNVVQQHALSIKRNIYSMAITIPPVRRDGDHSQRLLLNIGIRKYATRCSASVALLDMEPVFNASQKDTAYLWSRDSASKQGWVRPNGRDGLRQDGGVLFHKG